MCLKVHEMVINRVRHQLWMQQSQEISGRRNHIWFLDVWFASKPPGHRSPRYDSASEDPVAPVQETFWGRYFQAGKRDPQQMCPAPFVRKYFAQMFKDVKPLGIGFYALHWLWWLCRRQLCHKSQVAIWWCLLSDHAKSGQFHWELRWTF